MDLWSLGKEGAVQVGLRYETQQQNVAENAGLMLGFTAFNPTYRDDVAWQTECIAEDAGIKKHGVTSYVSDKQNTMKRL